MWAGAKPLLQAGDITIDPLIDAKDDPRRGLTLIFRPPESIVSGIQEFLYKAALPEPHQYYYPASDIHLTVLSIISCYPDFHPDPEILTSYQSIIHECIQETPPFTLAFRGVTASPAAVVIQGFNPGNQLNLLRDRLRQRFRDSQLVHTIDQRYPLQTAHLTVVRFRQGLDQPIIFADFIEQHRSTDFGACEVKEMALVYNDWYMREGEVCVLKGFLFK